MNEQLRGRYILDVLGDLEQVGGARFEQWLRPLWERLAEGPVNARGLSVKNAAVGYTLDAYWPDGSVSEASSQADYFEAPYQKLLDDFTHVLELTPEVKVVRLFSTQTAGPAASTYFESLKPEMSANGYSLDLWDGRRIAEYIVDHLLLDDRYVTRIGDALPNLRRIAEQNAVSNRIPPHSANYVGRDTEEAALQGRLAQEKTVVVAGFGGIGKTELACAVARRVRTNYEMVIWVDSAKLTGVEELRSYDVRLNGYRLNILNLLSNGRTLLVLDNVGSDLDIHRLDAACGAASNVLITSQTAFGTDPLFLGFVSDEHARAILSQDMLTPCPDDVLRAVLDSVEGHPLVLRLLNQHGLRHRGWNEVVRACQNIAAAADERRQTVADRILSRHLDTLGPELSFFSWCESPAVDAAFFEHVFGSIGVDKLERWCLTAKSQSDAIRLHDLVFASVQRVSHRTHVDEAWLTGKLTEFLAAHVAPKRLEFFRVVRRHDTLIERLLRASIRPGAMRYAYLHGKLPINLDPRLLGNPDEDVFQFYEGDLLVWMLSLVEAIEADYRRVRDGGDKASASATLEARLPVFDRLIANRRLPANLTTIARHHKAKSLIKLGRISEALAIFGAIIRETPASFASKLQVARLLEDDPKRARDLVFEIIEAEHTAPGAVSTSVLLETLGLLRRRHLREFVPEMTSKYGAFMASQLTAAACLGEDQPIRAFAAVGPDWSYTNPALFIEVMEAIEVGTPAEAEDDDERIAIGRVLTALGKMLLRRDEPTAARQNFERAEEFFTHLTRRPTPFASTHHADALIRLERFSHARDVLESVRTSSPNAFWYLRRSEADLGLGELPSALALLNEGLQELSSEDYKATFLNVRADILRAMGDETHLDCLREAIACCSSDKFRGELEEKIRTLLSS